MKNNVFLGMEERMIDILFNHARQTGESPYRSMALWVFNNPGKKEELFIRGLYKAWRCDIDKGRDEVRDFKIEHLITLLEKAYG